MSYRTLWNGFAYTTNTKNKFVSLFDINFLLLHFAPKHAYMDVGGRVTPGAVTEKSQTTCNNKSKQTDLTCMDALMSR